MGSLLARYGKYGILGGIIVSGSYWGLAALENSLKVVPGQYPPLVSLLKIFVYFVVSFLLAGAIVRESWPIAKRGVVVGGVLYLLFSLSIFANTLTCRGSENAACGYFDSLGYLLGILLIPIGALIGWIVGKVRRKNVVSAPEQ